MAKRPIFIPCKTGPALVLTKYVEFEWHPGLSISQKQRSIDALHSAAKAELELGEILEISTKSKSELGSSLSAFNLKFTTLKYARTFSVECAYQGSKVFANGGPFLDIFGATSIEAKKDPRLKSSGQLRGFRFFGTDWNLEPITAFYDWLYINALAKQNAPSNTLSRYDAFTDIEFNPEHSVNCQAYSVALFVALSSRNILEAALSSKDEFLRVTRNAATSNAKDSELSQQKLRLDP